MLRFLKKKEESVNVKDLREGEPSPARDWRVAICVFIGWIFLSCAITAYVFFNVTKGDVSDVATQENKRPVTIDETRLEKAIQFIEARNSSNN